MSYGLKYQRVLYRFKNTTPVYLDIYKKNYVGSVSQLTTAKVTVSMDSLDYFDTIASTSLEVRIVNDFDDFFELDELFSVSDFEYKVKVYDSSYIYFEGFIPCDVVEQQYFKKGTVVLNATNNLKRLNEYKPTLFTYERGYSYLEIIQHCLSFTGLEYPIYFNCQLKALLLDSTWETSTDNTFENHYSLPDIFRENDQEFKDCEFILDAILSSFDCVCYAWNGIWYIERWKDLGIINKQYIAYDGSSIQTYVNETLPQIQIGNAETKMRFTETTQTVRYIPGAKLIRLNLQEKQRSNYTTYFYENIDSVNEPYAELAAPDLSNFLKLDTATVTPVYKYFGIDRGVEFVDTDVDSDENSELLDPVYQFSPGDTYAAHYRRARRSMSGLFTRIRISKNLNNSTVLTIKYKIVLHPNFLNNGVSPNTTREVLLAHPENYKFYSRIFVRNYTTNNYIRYNKTTNTYYLQTGSWDMVGNGSSVDINDKVLSNEISFSNFTSKSSFYHEFSIDIPLDSFIDSLVGTNKELVIGILEVGYDANSFAQEGVNFGIKQFYIGDITVTVNGEDHDNVVEGAVTADFVNILEKDVLLYDVANENISNGIYWPANLETFSTLWKDAQGNTQLPLTKKMIEDRYQIYNKVRREIVGDVFYKNPLRPFCKVIDAHFVNNFLLNGFRWSIDDNIYQDCTLKEYVGDDNIT